MSNLEFFLAHRYDKATKQFIPFAYTNVAENVYLNIDSEETVADAITRLNQQANNAITTDRIADGAVTRNKLATEIINDINNRALASHNHNASDINEGTLAIARIPTGTTATTVALGNHTHPVPAPSAHSHNASDINAGTLALARIPTGTTATTVALGNHTHTAANVGASPVGHGHGAGDITSGTFAIARIPTGTTATTVALGNHTHTAANVGAAPSTHNHNASNINAGTLAIARIPTGTTATTVALGNHTHTTAQLGALPLSGGTLTGALTVNANIVRGLTTIWNSAIGTVGANAYSLATNNINRLTIATNGEATFTHTVTAPNFVGSMNANNLNAGTVPIARIPTGTTATTVALGNHTHTAANVGAAPTTHNHNASNINAGTLAIARIPTGTTATTVSLGNHMHVAASPNQTTVALGVSGNIPTVTGTRSVAIGLDASVGTDGVAVGSHTAALGESSISLRGHIATGASRGVAIGWSTMIAANCLNTTALGANVRVNHSQAIGLGGDHTNTGIAGPTTNSNQILLGGTNHTPFAHRALSIISDQRDKIDVTQLEYNALEFINKIRPVQYTLDFRANYTKMVEISPKDFDRLDAYTKRTKTRVFRRFSYMDVEYIDFEAPKSDMLDRYIPEFLKDICMSSEEAIRECKRKSSNITDEEIYASRKELEPIYFQYVTLERNGDFARKRKHNGVIAQQVKEVADEMGFDFAGFKDHAYKGDGDDLYSITYEEFIAPMIGSIQQLTKQNQDLSERVKILEKDFTT